MRLRLHQCPANGTPVNNLLPIEQSPLPDSHAIAGCVLQLKHELVTTAECGDLTRFSPRTIARWANSGVIPSIKVGTHGQGDRRFYMPDVIEALKKRFGRDPKPTIQ